MITVTKKFEFCYGHYLPEYDGKCANLHGHNSVVEVEVGPGPNKTAGRYKGMVMDFGDIKRVVGPIVDSLDHRNLNEHEDFIKFSLDTAIDLVGVRGQLEKIRPTAEVIVQYLAHHIKNEIPGLVRVRVTETPDSWAEWRK